MPGLLPTTDGRSASNLQNVIVYIDDLLVHSDTHEKRLEILEEVLNQHCQNCLKINLEKCIFGNTEVSYLGFTLTLEGIKPGKNKLKAIQQAKAPNIKDFAVMAAPLFKLARKDSGYKGGPLPQPAMAVFINL